MKLPWSRSGKAAEPGKVKRELVTPGNTKKALAVGKILAPALAPIAMQAAAVARNAWDERRARRLGVSPGDLNLYSGRGGSLHARISRIAVSMNELSASGSRGPEVDRFVQEYQPRLADLSAAVRAAEMMPTERRRAAHKAVAGELDVIEPRLLALLGVDSRNGSFTRPE
jgi:hypothetical protein